MTRESFNEARRLFDKISTYKNTLTSIALMLNDCSETSYNGDTVNVTIYNGKGQSHSAYINRTLVKNMLVGAKDHYEALVEKCENDIGAL